MADEDFVVDLREYRDRQGSLVPDGRYRVQVTDVEFTKAQSSGNPVIVLYLRVLGGPEDGATLVDRLTQTPNALFRTVNFMRAIKLPTPNKRLKISKKTLIDKVLEVDVEEGEPYNGSTRSEIRGYISVGAGKAASNGTAKKKSDDEGDELDGLEEFSSETTSNPAKAEEKAEDEGSDSTTQGDDESSEDEAEDLDLEEISL